MIIHCPECGAVTGSGYGRPLSHKYGCPRATDFAKALVHRQSSEKGSLGTISDETLRDIEQSCKTVKELEKKSNADLASLLVEHVWSRLDMFTATSDLLSIIIDRLRDERAV